MEKSDKMYIYTYHTNTYLLEYAHSTIVYTYMYVQYVHVHLPNDTDCIT